MMVTGDLGQNVDFESRFAGHPIFRGFSQRDFVEYILYKYNEQAVVKVTIGKPDQARPSTEVMYKDGRATAWLNAGPLEIAPLPVGRWIANCPFCAGAEYVDFQTGLFMCCGCWNASIGFQWLKLKLPSPSLRGQIDRLTLARPPYERHWLPNETLENMRMQNIQKGYPV